MNAESTSGKDGNNADFSNSAENYTSKKDLAYIERATRQSFDGLVGDCADLEMLPADIAHLKLGYDLLLNGSSLADIPKDEIVRWVNRNAAAIIATRGNLDDLSKEEIERWTTGIEDTIAQMVESRILEMFADKFADLLNQNIIASDKLDRIKNLSATVKQAKAAQQVRDELGRLYDGSLSTLAQHINIGTIESLRLDYENFVLFRPEEDHEQYQARWLSYAAANIIDNNPNYDDLNSDARQALEQDLIFALRSAVREGAFNNGRNADTFISAIEDYREVDHRLALLIDEIDYVSDVPFGETPRLRDRVQAFKDWLTVKEAGTAARHERSRFSKIATAVGLVAVIYTILNRTYVGVEHGFGEALSSSTHLDFDLGKLVGKLFSSNEHSSITALDKHDSQHGGEVNPGAKEPLDPNAHPDKSTKHYDPVEAGHYGRKGENPGSLDGFAKDILKQHHIDTSDPNYKQAHSQVLSKLIATNETWGGKKHGINVHQMINVNEAHQVASGFEQHASEPVNPPVEKPHPDVKLENSQLPSDWPADTKLSTDQLNALNIDSGMSGEQLVEQLGYNRNDWYSIGPDLYSHHDDAIYLENGDYRLRKKGYPSWSFVQDLLNLLSNKK